VGSNTDQAAVTVGSPKQPKPSSLAQSQSYSALLQLAKDDGQDSTSLRLLLILINAHPELKAHSRIFENLSLILETSPIQHALTCNPSWGNQVVIWKELCKWIASNTNRFSQDNNLKILVYAESRKNKKEHHPLSRNGPGFTRHGVCSSLFNRHESSADYTTSPAPNTVAYSYLCLQAQLFIAYLNCRYDPIQLSAMESYAGMEDWPKIPIASGSVCRAVRQMKFSVYSDLLFQLKADIAPVDFYHHLPNVQFSPGLTAHQTPVGAKRIKKEVDLILFYLKSYFASVDKHLSGNKPAAATGKRKSKRNNRRPWILTGYLPVVEGIVIKHPPKEDDEDIATDPAGEVQVSDNPDDPECKETERTGLAPDEDRTPTIKLYNPDDFGGAMMRAKQAEMAKSMAAQKFSWDYEVLTSTELRRLWSLLNRTISDIGTINSNDSPKSYPLQCALMLKIMLLLGQDLETVRTLHISHDGSTDTDGLVFHPPNKGKPAWWQLPSLEPQYRTDLPEKMESFGRTKLDYISLPDIGGLGSDVLTYLKKTGRNLKTVFSPEKKTAKKGTQDLLDQTIEIWIDPKTGPGSDQESTPPKPPQKPRITLTKIRNALRTRLRQLSGDNTIEWITSAQIIHRNEPRLHYTNLSDHQVVTAYIAAARRLLKDLGEPVIAVPDIVASSPGYHGARFVASMDSIATLASSVAKQLKEPPSHYDRDGIIDYHNTFTFHVWMVQSLFTSIRAINNPDSIISAHANNPLSKYAGLSDKENPDQADKARLVRLPELLRQQIEEYRLHVDRIRCEFGIKPMLVSEKKEVIPRLFILVDSGEPGPVTCSWCQTTMDELGIPLPGNFHRGFLRSELIARGCPGQVVDAFLGHFNQGESPFFIYSTMDYLKLQDKLFITLEQLIKETGISFHSSALVLK